jgi:hypothetical protein
MSRTQPISYKQSQRSIEAGKHKPIKRALADCTARTRDLPRGTKWLMLRRLFDPQDVGRGVEGWGLVDQPFGGSQGAPDEGVAMAGSRAQGNPRRRPPFLLS